MKYDKRALYTLIAAKRCEFGLDDSFPVDVYSIAKNETIELHYHRFKSDSIGAVLYKDTKSGILINKNKHLNDQRFDIAHELIHYWFHPNFTSFSLNNPASRDTEKEWQANEGAAELLLPYKDFIPNFIKTAKYSEENYEPAEYIYDSLAQYYKVNPVVVDYRIRNLENEILEHLNGVSLEKIFITRSNIKLNKNKLPVLYISLIKRLRKNFYFDPS